MSAIRNRKYQDEYKKAQDLKVIVKFERDDSPEGELRMEQAKAIICQLILLGKKRGRPSKRELEEINAAA
jgi:hypothetical protein